MQTNKLNLVRHGFADWLEIKHNKFYLSYHHLTGNVEICKFVYRRFIVHDRLGKVNRKYWRKDQIIVHNGKYEELAARNPLNNIKQLESLLNDKLPHEEYYTINPDYIEAYYVGANNNTLYDYVNDDVSVFKGLLVDNMTVGEVISNAKQFNFIHDFKGYKIGLIIDLLKHNREALYAMPFVQFYTLLHNSNYKQDYRNIVEAALTNNQQQAV